MITLDAAREAVLEYNRTHSKPGNRLRLSLDEWRDLLGEAIREGHCLGGTIHVYGAKAEIIDGEWYGDRVRHQQDPIR